MLQPLRINKVRRAISGQVTIPAPVGGLNAKDQMSNMPITDALILDNFFPSENNVALRKGYTSHATGVGSAEVETLMTYHAYNGTEQLFGCASSAIYSATTTGAAASVYSTGITSNRWQYINFSTTAQLYIIAVNGVNTPIKYNGSVWSTNAFSGSITSANIINIAAHKERIWLVEKNSLSVWYLASGAIAGTATKFPLAGVFTEGGQVKAIGSFSVSDSGDGIDDLWCAITDNGEVAVYTGTDPSSANTWSLANVFHIGEPLGHRCTMKIGGDLIVLTTLGAVSMRQIMQYDRSKENAVAVTAKIAEKFNSAAKKWSGNFGWQAINYHNGRYAIFNVPEAQGVRQTQFVQNTITGAWCVFKGMNANCWGFLNSELYFGGNDGKIYKADSGRTDNGAPIVGEVKSAFTDCGVHGLDKFFTMIRPYFLTGGIPSITIGVNVDYDNILPTGQLEITSNSVGVWGTGSSWGTSKWGGSGLLQNSHHGIGRIGSVVASRFKVSSSGISVQYNGCDILHERGSFL